MISSPPQEPAEFRGKSLSPASPQPLHIPSPSNIPLLDKSMDPMFNEQSLSIGTPASFQSYSQQNHTPGAQSNASYYAEQQLSNYQNGAANASLGAQSEYPQSTAFGSGYGTNSQDTSSIQNFASHNHASAPSYSEATSSTPNTDNRSAYPMTYDLQAQSPYGLSSQAQSTPGSQYQAQPSNNGGVNIQSLLDKLSPQSGHAPAVKQETPATLSAQGFQNQGAAPSTSTLPAAPHLPPRPPPQEKPATHPNYAPEDDIRSYHPHSQKPPNASYRPQQGLQPLMTQGASGTGHAHGYAPLSATSNPTPSTPSYLKHEAMDAGFDEGDDEDSRWPPEINRLYEEFLDDERKYVTDGQWDQFPVGSRLFIGNLPTEKVTKRDIFHRFYRHGKLAQISIKQAYGFVQFLDANSCYRALQVEQGQTVRGRKMHLEISKPQRNTRKPDGSVNNQNGARRRSRSPDYTRGGTGQQPGRVDRYTGNQNAISPRERDARRGRDDYRPIRSPSPRGGRRNRSRDRYDGRRRSRSRTPPGRGRYRSPSPRRETDDELPLPRRRPHEVPDIQVIVVNELPRDFISWVEKAFLDRGIKIDVLLLSARLSEAAVIRRQILEGVLAISKLTPASLAKGKINLQLFDRRAGADNVRFEEYADLDPATAAMLVLNAKQSQATPIPTPQTPQYGLPPQSYTTPTPQLHGYPPAQPSAAQPPNNQNLSSLITSLDSNGLQKLLNTISSPGAAQSQSQPQTPQSAGLTPDLARLLGSVSAAAAPPTPTYGQQQPATNPYASLANNPAFASLLGGQHQQQPSAAPPVQTPQGQPDMNQIMAQLAKYRR